MELNMQSWKEFCLGRLFCISPTKAYKNMLNTDLEDGGTVPFVINSAENNAIGGYSTLEATEKGNIITFSDTTDGNTFFYQPDDFIGFPHVQAMRPINHVWTNFEMIFLSAVVMFHNKGLFNYGRKMRRDKISAEYIKLPIQRDADGIPVIDSDRTYSDEGYIPDWQFMDDYIQSLHSRPITTTVAGDHVPALGVEMWQEFALGQLFDVEYGINMELVNCDETTADDPEGIAFVARTAENNGISAYVKPVPGKIPQPAGTITCAGGGSVLSTFVQDRDFYSGRDLYLLHTKEALSLPTKLFLTTIIMQNQYRYSYGRQANVTMPSLLLKLPVKHHPNGEPVLDPDCTYSSEGYIPDWQFMEDYINSLPYADRLNG